MWVVDYLIIHLSGLILGLRPANERRRYFVTTSLIGWEQAWFIVDDRFNTFYTELFFFIDNMKSYIHTLLFIDFGMGLFKFVLVGPVFILRSQYHCSWWPGDIRNQGISSNGIDLFLTEYSGLSIRMRWFYMWERYTEKLIYHSLSITDESLITINIVCNVTVTKLIVVYIRRFDVLCLMITTEHYTDVIMGAIASQITSLTIVYSLIQTQIKENITAPRHWPLCGVFTGDRWIPRTNGQ